MTDQFNWENYIKSVKRLKNSNKIVCSPSSRNLRIHTLSRKYSSNNVIDLHGFTLDQAYQHLKSFLKNSFENNLRDLVIITGKGRPEKPGIIKLEVERWLKYTELNNNILKFQVVTNSLGEEQGAIRVTLRRNKGSLKYD